MHILEKDFAFFSRSTCSYLEASFLLVVSTTMRRTVENASGMLWTSTSASRAGYACGWAFIEAFFFRQVHRFAFISCP